MKQVAKSAQSSTPRLDAARAQLQYSGATALLSKFEAWRSEHFAALENLKMGASRLEEGVRNYIRLDRTQCLARDVTAVANDLIAGKDLHAVITAARAPLEKTIYNAIRLAEPDDLQVVRKIDFERAAVMALDRAIQLQKKNITAARSQEISELFDSLAGERATTARQLLSLLKNLDERAEKDRGLVRNLDPSEIESLRPPPFPMRILGPEARSWFLDCVETGLIEAAEISDLRRD